MICEWCALAADTSQMSYHECCNGCDCQHKRVDQPRITIDVKKIACYVPVSLQRYRRTSCPVCKRTVALTSKGTLYWHKQGKWTCGGTGEPGVVEEWEEYL